MRTMTSSRHSDAIPFPLTPTRATNTPQKNSPTIAAKIRELRQKMRDVQAAVEPEPVTDYTFRRAGGGSVRLSELFGDKADLFVIHHMGQSCPYCTLLADGF